jgi:2-keto-4-pentenoate hydratase/2-oxohepta-3-ene-1,7-dioic acid hydratase in catechol pathway
MRIVRLLLEGQETLALNTDRGHFPIAAVRDVGSSNILEFINSKNAELESLETDIANLAADAAINMEKATFLVPVARPGKIICLGLNYHAHAAEGGFTPPEYPVVFFRCATSLTPHNGPIKIPANSNKLDYEGEMAVIIGKEAYCVSEENALDYVAGYSIFNDATIRDYQKKTHQWTVGKNFDKTGGFGPELVTAEELPQGGKGLRLRTLLNGNVQQDATTGDMIFGVAKIIQLMSECFTLEPGDVIVSGTPEGVGYVRKPPVYMQDGDEVVIEIEGIGKLINHVSFM